MDLESLKPLIRPDKWEWWKAWKITELKAQIEQLESEKKLLEYS